MRLPALITGKRLPAVYSGKQEIAVPKVAPTEAGPIVLAGNLIVILFFGVLGTWAALAPLASAVIAPGAIKVEGNNKAVQHLDGGIVREILVKEGDEVKE